MAELLNQHQLAARIGRSRVSIIKWGRQGMPVVKSDGPGKEKFYDLVAVLAWMEKTGVGMRVDLGPPGSQPHDQRVQTSAPTVTELERVLSRAIAATVPGLVFLAMRRGFTADLALELADELVVCAFTNIEKYLGRESIIWLEEDGLARLMDDSGRAHLVERGRQLLAEFEAEERAAGG